MSRKTTVAAGVLIVAGAVALGGAGSAWRTRAPQPAAPRDYPVRPVPFTAVYRADDTGRGELRVPASWRVLYAEAGAWVPVEAREAYGVEKDRYNRVTFTPVRTPGRRLEVVPRPEWSAGVVEWQVQSAPARWCDHRVGGGDRGRQGAAGSSV